MAKRKIKKAATKIEPPEKTPEVVIPKVDDTATRLGVLEERFEKLRIAVMKSQSVRDI